MGFSIGDPNAQPGEQTTNGQVTNGQTPAPQGQQPAPGVAGQQPVDPSVQTQQPTQTEQPQGDQKKGDEAIAGFFEAIRKAAANEDPEVLANLVDQGRKQFTPEAWAKIEPVVQNIISELAKGNLIDRIVTEVVGTLATGGPSGRLGLKGVNILTDPADVPDFSIPGWWETLAKGGTTILANVLDAVGGFFSGAINVGSFGTVDLGRNPKFLEDQGIDVTKPRTVSPGDPEYAMFEKIPAWMRPLFDFERQSDGTFKTGGRSAAETLGRGAGTAYALIFTPAKVKNLVKSGFQRVGPAGQMLRGPLGVQFAINLNRAVGKIRGIRKAPGNLEQLVTNALFNKFTAGVTGYAAAYAYAEQIIDGVFRDYEVEFNSEEDRAKAQYWFAGNYITTMFIASLIDLAAEKIPPLRKTENIRKVTSIIFAELGTTGIIAAGTYNEWERSVSQTVTDIVNRAIATAGFSEEKDDTPSDDEAAAARGYYGGGQIPSKRDLMKAKYNRMMRVKRRYA